MIKKVFLIALFGSLSATYATLPDSAVANAQAWYQHYGATLSTAEQKECAEFLLGFQKVSYWTAAIKHAV